MEMNDTHCLGSFMISRWQAGKAFSTLAYGRANYNMVSIFRPSN